MLLVTEAAKKNIKSEANMKKVTARISTNKY